MIVKSRRYQISIVKYIAINLLERLKKHLIWLLPISAVIISIPIIYNDSLLVCIIVGILLLIFYILFWVTQFFAFSQLEENKFFFQKIYYEISDKRILIHTSTKKTFAILWPRVKKVRKTKSAYIIICDVAFILYIPFKIIRNSNDRLLLRNILKNKNHRV